MLETIWIDICKEGKGKKMERNKMNESFVIFLLLLCPTACQLAISYNNSNSMSLPALLYAWLCLLTFPAVTAQVVVVCVCRSRN